VAEAKELINSAATIPGAQQGDQARPLNWVCWRCSLKLNT
jgi:hypothetical protein